MKIMDSELSTSLLAASIQENRRIFHNYDEVLVDVRIVPKQEFASSEALSAEKESKVKKKSVIERHAKIIAAYNKVNKEGKITGKTRKNEICNVVRLILFGDRKERRMYFDDTILRVLEKSGHLK